jgi:CheY-like chemotaxis protein
VMVKKVLSKKEWNVIATFNGQEAIDAILSNQINLVITDIMMPLVDGIELLKFIKSSPNTKNIPVIGFSAGNKQQILGKLYEYQFDYFFEKPMNLNVLTDKAEILLHRPSCLN